MSRSGYTKETGEKKISILHTAKSVGIAYVVSVVLLLVLSVFMSFRPIENKTVNFIITLITCLSVAVGGFSASRSVGKCGLINGALAGIIYTALLYLIGGVANGGLAFNGATVFAICLGVICGGLGGIVGVNTKKRGR